MNIEELRAEMRRVKKGKDSIDEKHLELDRLLLEYINDSQVNNIFDDTPKWYSQSMPREPIVYVTSVKRGLYKHHKFCQRRHDASKFVCL